MGLTPEQETLIRRAEVLILACRDLLDVAVSVDSFLNPVGPAHHLESRVKQVLEAGILVTYVRPFKGSSPARSIGLASELSQELMEFHEDIVLRRNKVYAHTDHTDVRQIPDLRLDDAVAAFIAGDDDTVIHEEWDSLTEEGLACLRELARIHFTACHAEVDRLRDRLRAPKDA